MTSSIPRYLPDEEFPEYAYVPGHRPHPENDPEGHSYNEEEVPPTPLEPDRWRDCPEYLHGIDLFNHGYYWEAHEAWERLWHAAGRTGPTADFLRALIKLAAAGVKVRQGNQRGVLRHAESGGAEFRQLADEQEVSAFAGLELNGLIDFTRRIRERAGSYDADPGRTKERVFERVLEPGG